ncbi:MAG: hypothetical protein R3F43_23880 [bacterium]
MRSLLLALLALLALSALAHADPAIRLIEADGTLTDVSGLVQGLDAVVVDGLLTVSVGERAIQVPTEVRNSVIVLPGPVVGLAPGQRIAVGGASLTRFPSDLVTLSTTSRYRAGADHGLAQVSFGGPLDPLAATGVVVSDLSGVGIVITDTSAGFWGDLPAALFPFAQAGGAGITVRGMVSAMPGIGN